jgi:hypothetical protein
VPLLQRPSSFTLRARIFMRASPNDDCTIMSVPLFRDLSPRVRHRELLREGFLTNPDSGFPRSSLTSRHSLQCRELDTFVPLSTKWLRGRPSVVVHVLHDPFMIDLLFPNNLSHELFSGGVLAFPGLVF